MKNLIILLITVFSFQCIDAQEFIATNKYTIKSEIATKQQEYKTTLFEIISTEESSKIIASLAIENPDFLEDIAISVLPNPNLDNITEVIKVDINYNACCIHTETHYFMVTDENDFISLPQVDNTYCENTVSEIQYIFPVQPLGKENSILRTTVNFTETFTVKNIEVLQSFVWNDDEFMAENDKALMPY